MLNQSNKFSTIGHRINSQISEEFGCTDAEYFSLFKMTTLSTEILPENLKSTSSNDNE